MLKISRWIKVRIELTDKKTCWGWIYLKNELHTEYIFKIYFWVNRKKEKQKIWWTPLWEKGCPKNFKNEKGTQQTWKKSEPFLEQELRVEILLPASVHFYKALKYRSHLKNLVHRRKFFWLTTSTEEFYLVHENSTYKSVLLFRSAEGILLLFQISAILVFTNSNCLFLIILDLSFSPPRSHFCFKLQSFANPGYILATNLLMYCLTFSSGCVEMSSWSNY